MKNLVFEQWDEGRLTVNSDFRDVLRENGLTTFRAIADFEAGEVAKGLRRDRMTFRLELESRTGPHAFYLKRHGPPPWKEYVKPLLRGRWPIVGARNEWNALLRFHRVGIPTMVPVALGISGRASFLLTEALDGHGKLSAWMEDHLRNTRRDAPLRRETRRIVESVARIARTMHGSGMHHQDFYAGHLLMDNSDGAIHVIDLGRVRKQRRLGTMWIVKDLAQLDYSARLVSAGDRLRFLRAYLGRPLQAGDRTLIRKVRSKSESVARHSKKNRL